MELASSICVSDVFFYPSPFLLYFFREKSMFALFSSFKSGEFILYAIAIIWGVRIKVLKLKEFLVSRLTDEIVAIF